MIVVVVVVVVVVETTFSCGFEVVSRTMHQTGCSLDCKHGRVLVLVLVLDVGWGLVCLVCLVSPRSF